MYGANRLDLSYLSMRTLDTIVAAMLTTPRMIVAMFESTVDPARRKMFTE